LVWFGYSGGRKGRKFKTESQGPFFDQGFFKEDLLRFFKGGIRFGRIISILRPI
jgi:hypothetical protein